MQVIENFFSHEVFEDVYENVFQVGCPFYMQQGITEKDDGFYYFVHQFYKDNKPITTFYDFYYELIKKQLNVDILLRGKINIYNQTHEVVEHKLHTDYPYKHKVALLSLNDCNGFTILEDGTKLPSKKNQMVIFDGSKNHKSTSCTDAPFRANIIINYLDKECLV